MFTFCSQKIYILKEIKINTTAIILLFSLLRILVGDIWISDIVVTSGSFGSTSSLAVQNNLLPFLYSRLFGELYKAIKLNDSYCASVIMF